MHIHHDVLGELNNSGPLKEKLRFLHRFVEEKHEFIERIAVTIHDPRSDLLRTYADSTRGSSPLHHYERKLAEVPSLKRLADNGQPRVLNNLAEQPSGNTEHARRIAEKGYGASYTLPVYDNGMFLGFIFFDAGRSNCLTTAVLEDLDVVGHLLSLTLSRELVAVQTMSATLKTAHEIFNHRDAETGSHLTRMAQYAKLIAMELAGRYGLSDEYIEHIHLYAPLHDIGKIGIPDDVLMKPGSLTEQEFAIMKEHVRKGRDIVNAMLENFGQGNFQYPEILRNIVELHHEAINGDGYLKGLKGQDIPIESRIVAVADVFDALTSDRPYKGAWPNQRAFALLRELAGSKLDPDCVQALCRNEAAILEIQARNRENGLDQDLA